MAGDKVEIRIGVRSLVEQVLRSGDLESGFAGPGRALEGIRAHQRVQRMRPADYRSEVPVSLSLEKDRFVLMVSGRVDGVLATAERTVVEEIKATARPLDDLVPSPLHWGQARAYAHLHLLDVAAAAVTVRLTYVQLDTGAIREFEEEHDRQGLERFFDDLIDRYLAWAGTLADWRTLRHASAAGMDFPFPRYRPGQREMAVAVYRAAAGGDRLLVQAATGIGKTMAAVFPAVKALAGAGVERVFYLTARTTGRLAAEKAFDVLRGQGLRLKVLTLTAKDRICFAPDAACHPDECPFARGYYDRLEGAVTEMFQEDAWTRSALETTARDHGVCPFDFSLEMALWADAVIGDVNYAFDPRVYLRRFFADEGGRYLFLVDEAHNLVDRSRDMFSAEIRKQAFLDLRRAMGKTLPGLHRLMGRINAELVKARKAADDEGGWCWTPKAPEALAPLLRRFLFAAEAWLVKNQRTGFRQALLDLYFAVSGFVRVFDRYDEDYAACYEIQGKDLRVKLFCMDPSRQMAEALERCHAAVFFSATLTPFDYYAALFGCGSSFGSLCLPSPFPPQNLALRIVTGISTLYRDRARTARAVSEILASLVTQQKGNYLLFFPSYAYLTLVLEHFSQICSGVEALVQAPAMNEAQKEAFLARFSRDNSRPLAGFVVMGGIFGEGIDLAGDRLSGAAVVGVGLPGITPEQELIRSHFDHRSGQGFDYAYRYPGFTRVLQAAGRVIRGGRDRGVVVLVDRRFAATDYARLFPPYWQPKAVSSPSGLKRSLLEFWQGKAE